MPSEIRRHFPFPTLAAVKAYRMGVLRSEPDARIVGLERCGAWWVAMRKSSLASFLALLLTAVLGLAGCSCAVPAGLTTVGLAATLLTHDSNHVIQPGLDLVACVLCPPPRDR